MELYEMWRRRESLPKVSSKMVKEFDRQALASLLGSLFDEVISERIDER